MKAIANHLKRRWPIYIGAVALFLAGALVAVNWARIPLLMECLLHFAPLGTMLSAVVAVLGLMWQAWRARYNQRIDLILKFAERFEKPEWRRIRAKAASALRENRDTSETAVSDVLSFFEEIGFLFDRKAIDLDAVYEFFEFCLIPYYQATESYVARERQETRCPDLFVKFDKLFLELTLLELMRTGSTPLRSATEVDKFLEAEGKQPIG